MYIIDTVYMRVTIKDIARETGLSISTVSFILNNKGDRFPLETRKLVFDAANTLNYRPNQLAIGLLTKKTSTLGLIIPDISNLFFSELTKGIEDRSRQSSYNVILCNSNDKYSLEKQCINTLADRSVDGIIMVMSAETSGSKSGKCLSLLRSLGIPAILVDCFNEVEDFSTTAIDNYEGASLATRYLLDLGHRRIACITGPLGIATNKERLNGYSEILKQNNIELDPSLIYEGDFRYQSGYKGAARLLEQKPTALFCHNDMMAYGAARALKDKGYRIPGDISLMGFDDIFFSQYLDVPLSTIMQPVYEMGVCSAAMLLEEILDNNKPKQKIMFTPQLVIRQSTAYRADL